MNACAVNNESGDTTNSAGGQGTSLAGTGVVERGGIVEMPQMCVDMVTGGIPP